jgi:hypothetical protein
MRLKADKSEQRSPAPEDVAISVLTWLGNEPEMLSRFLSLTGIDVGDLRQISSNPGFSAALLEFILAHEPTLEAFCGESGLPPETVAHAWQILSGPSYGGTGA